MIWLIYALFFIALYFEVFMLLAFITTKTDHAEAGTLENSVFPRVTIIVPCFNEEATLPATMHSLLSLNYPREMLDIIVVNDGSHDNTLAVARTFETDPRVRVFDKPNGGKHTAMNFALEHTKSEFIGCLDADSIVDSEALRAIVPVFTDKRVAAVTPGILIKKPQTVIQHMQDAEYRLSVFNRFTLAALGSAFITPGPFSIYRTSIVRDMKGWRHGHSTEDLEMALCIQDAGYIIANAPSAVVYTGSPRTVHALFKQRVRWTYGFLRNSIDYHYMFGNRKYGNLSIIILPMALLSIFAAIIFFARLTYLLIAQILHAFERWQIVGIQWHAPSFDLFYINTSMLIVLVMIAIGLVIGLIAIGTELVTGKRRVPFGTAFFVLLYSFIVPLWLATAVVRAVFKTGVRWR
jgi:cellulose synthase/poly-beta-1,6-N-acetylglucosamine synthase-like glycosyltransferase